MEILPIDRWIPSYQKPLVVAGPCSAESCQQVVETAVMLSKVDQVRIFRAGLWKPRTRPGCFQGVGAVGLDWLNQAKRASGLLVATEVARGSHVDCVLKAGIDVIWIGARTMASPFAVQEIADSLKGVDIPVMVKNPVNPDLHLWIGAIERLYDAGLRKLVAVHRGFSSYEKSKLRNPPQWRIPLELRRRIPSLPIICDPSHISGNRDNLEGIAQQAINRGMEGLMVESHLLPEQAQSDARQQITPADLKSLLERLMIKQESSSDFSFDEKLQNFRSQIDRLDADLIEILCLRMKVSREIGRMKIENNVTPFQAGRMEELMKDRIAHGNSLQLEERYIKELFEVIHEASLKEQS